MAQLFPVRLPESSNLPTAMTSLKIEESDIPRLDGKVALVTGFSPIPLCRPSLTFSPTGGASGIGLAAVRILADAGAKTFMLDIDPPAEAAPESATFIKCDVTSWADLRAAFTQADRVDIAIANAGVSEDQPYFEDRTGDDDELLEPTFRVLDVNFKGVVLFAKLAVSYMRKHGAGGSIVVTASATAYAPEQNLPVYSATKLGVGNPSSLLSHKALMTARRQCARDVCYTG